MSPIGVLWYKVSSNIVDQWQEYQWELTPRLHQDFPQVARELNK